MCQHIVSAARVLRQANSHMLLLGIGGTGKKAVIQLACFMEFCEFVQPVYTKTYSDNDLIEDLRKVMLKAGLHSKKVVFYMDNRNIAKVSKGIRLSKPESSKPFKCYCWKLGFPVVQEYMKTTIYNLT